MDHSVVFLVSYAPDQRCQETYSTRREAIRVAIEFVTRNGRYGYKRRVNGRQTTYSHSNGEYEAIVTELMTERNTP